MATTRLATEADLPAVAALFDERDRTRYPLDAVARRLAGFDRSRAATIVATIDDRIVAMSTLVLRRFGTTRRSEIASYWTDLYVAESNRNDALYLPIARATLAASTESGASFVMTANRRRDVWSSHLKLGFRIASALPTRARPVGALGTALRLTNATRLADAITGLDSLAFGLVDRVAKRPRPTIATSTHPFDESTAQLVVSMLARDRGRSSGTIVDAAEVRRRFTTPLEGRPYRVIVAHRDGVPSGAAIVRTARRSRLELTVVLELLDGGDADVFHGLVQAVESFAREAGTDLVLALDGVAEQSARWDEAGYPSTPEWYVLLVAPAERTIDRALGDGTSWRFPFAEHDAF